MKPSARVVMPGEERSIYTEAVIRVLLGEMFPNRLRGAALAVSGAMKLGDELPGHGNVPAVAKGLGLTEAYALYVVVATISIPFVWSVVRETKGKTLEEM